MIGIKAQQGTARSGVLLLQDTLARFQHEIWLSLHSGSKSGGCTTGRWLPHPHRKGLALRFLPSYVITQRGLLALRVTDRPQGRWFPLTHSPSASCPQTTPRTPPAPRRSARAEPVGSKGAS